MLFLQISTLWRGSRTLEAVLVTGVRTATSGYLDLVSTVGGKVGSTMWAGTCHTAVPFVGRAVATWVFPHSEVCWELILQNVSTVTSMGLLENFKQRAVLHHQQNARSGPRRSCSAAEPECREADWTMRWFRVAPPVTQNSQEVRTCCIRMCRRAKKTECCERFCVPFAKLVSVHSKTDTRVHDILVKKIHSKNKKRQKSGTD